MCKILSRGGPPGGFPEKGPGWSTWGSRGDLRVQGGVPGGVPHMVGGVPPGPPNGALGYGPYGPSSGSSSQYSQGGYPPGPPQDRAWCRGHQSPPPGPTTIHATAKRIATLHAGGPSPAHPPGLLHRSDERSESRGSMLEGEGHAMPSLWVHGGKPHATGAIAPPIGRPSSWLGRVASRSTCDPACSWSRWGAAPPVLAA